LGGKINENQIAHHTPPFASSVPSVETTRVKRFIVASSGGTVKGFY
jgi:hypothetical protein